MKRSHWQSALKTDFSKDSALKEALLLDLMQRPNAPTDMKEDAPMNQTVKRPARALLFALIALMLLSGVALAAMKTFSLGPYATYTHWDGQAVRQVVYQFANDNRAVWEGKVFDRDGQPIEDLAAHMWRSLRVNTPYEQLYGADGQPCNLINTDGIMTIADPEERSNILYTSFDTLAQAKPLLNAKLDPKLPTAPPDGYQAKTYSAVTYTQAPDAERLPRHQADELVIDYERGVRRFTLTLKLLSPHSTFDTVAREPLEELTINGHDAIREGDGVLHMLAGDILYTFNAGDSGVSMDELKGMAASVG